MDKGSPRWTSEVPEPAEEVLCVLASGAGLKEPGGSQGPCSGQWVGGCPGRELGSGWEEGRRGAWNAVKPLTPIPASGNQSRGPGAWNGQAWQGLKQGTLDS